MKKGSVPIPLASVVVLPRAVMIGGVVLSAGCIVAGFVLLGYGIATASGAALGGYLGGALGCIFGGAGGLFGTLCDWKRRVTAPLLFAYLQQDRPSLLFRRVFWPAVVLCAIGVVAGLTWGGPLAWHGGVQTGGMLAFMSGTTEAIRRHLHRLASAIFTLYAEGVLDPVDAAAIDDARAKNPDFDAAVRRHQELILRLAELP